MSEAASEVVEAFAFAAQAHSGQTRKNKRDPYLDHLAEVAVLCARHEPFDRVLVVAAILHDTLEKTGADAAILNERFGAEVAALVAEVTDPEGLGETDRRRRQVEHAAMASSRAKLLKIADKTSNLDEVAREIPEGWSVEKVADYAEWGRKVVAACRGLNPELEAAFDAAYGRVEARLAR